MKRFYLFLIIVSALLCACKDEYNSSVDVAKYGETIEVYFEYNRRSPLMYEFTNKSYGCVSYRWDFGDGTFATGKDAMKSFDAIGKYKVTLTGTAKDGKTYKQSQVITVTKPKMYIFGVKFYRIPYESRYYSFQFKDDALLPSTWDEYFGYTAMLNNSDLPYGVKLDTHKEFVNLESHEYYTVYVYRTNDPSSKKNDVQCLKQQLKVKDLLRYEQEYILENTGTAIGVVMDYEY